MKTLLKLAGVAFALIIATTTVFAQEWTKEQKEVWKVVEDSWTNWKAWNIEGTVASIHEKYQGWSEDDPLPMSKASQVEWYTTMKEMRKNDYFSLNPARIVVTDNAAVVDYYYSFSVTYIAGDVKKQENKKGKNAEFYVKEGGKWLLLGDMTVYDDEDDD